MVGARALLAIQAKIGPLVPARASAAVVDGEASSQNDMWWASRSYLNAYFNAELLASLDLAGVTWQIEAKPIEPYADAEVRSLERIVGTGDDAAHAHYGLALRDILEPAVARHREREGGTKQRDDLANDHDWFDGGLSIITGKHGTCLPADWQHH